MHGGRLSAAETGKQNAADVDADLPPAVVLKSAANWYQYAGGGQLVRRRPAGDAAVAANCHAVGSSGVRHLLLGPPSGGTSETEEEAPPSPPPSSGRRLPALTAEDAAAGLAAVARLEGMVKEIQAALDRELRELEDAKRRRGGAEVQWLQNKLGTLQAKVSGVKDKMLAFRLRAERKTK